MTSTTSSASATTASAAPGAASVAAGGAAASAAFGTASAAGTTASADVTATVAVLASPPMMVTVSSDSGAAPTPSAVGCPRSAWLSGALGSSRSAGIRPAIAEPIPSP